MNHFNFGGTVVTLELDDPLSQMSLIAFIFVWGKGNSGEGQRATMWVPRIILKSLDLATGALHLLNHLASPLLEIY